MDTPSWSYTAPSEINNIAWGATNGGSNGWIAAGCGRLVQILKV